MSLKTSKNTPETFYCDDNFGGTPFKNFYDVQTRFGTPSSKEATPESSDEVAETLCDSVKSKIFPKTLPNILNKMVVIVNYGKFKQEISIERCR